MDNVNNKSLLWHFSINSRAVDPHVKLWIGWGLLMLSLLMGTVMIDLIRTGAELLTTIHPVPARLNEAVDDGDLRFVVRGAHCGIDQVGTANLGQRARGEFCFVELSILNSGTAARLFDATGQKAFDAAGATFLADGAAGLYADDRNRSLLETIGPGRRVRGTLVFDVPDASHLDAVVLHGSAGSPGVRIALGWVASGDG
ncbi:DUF4352 domain-containing protein [Winogradskya consettensis]|uniref:DUF4352 domain-containing protein n=1 Tax=Winogradskya consettensis TaxID=113560 RepID=UPI001BB3A2C4|nr:DUF4352 domain-containing protein [Actinoplanes consettensis]